VISWWFKGRLRGEWTPHRSLCVFSFDRFFAAVFPPQHQVAEKMSRPFPSVDAFLGPVDVSLACPNAWFISFHRQLSPSQVFFFFSLLKPTPCNPVSRFGNGGTLFFPNAFFFKKLTLCFPGCFFLSSILPFPCLEAYSAFPSSVPLSPRPSPLFAPSPPGPSPRTN